MVLQKLTTLLSLAPALAPALAANRTHYGDPNTHPLQPCLADEVRAQITGLAGDLCIPPCDAAGKCPQDKPAGVEALPQCVLKSSTGAQVSGYTSVWTEGDFGGGRFWREETLEEILEFRGDFRGRLWRRSNWRRSKGQEKIQRSGEDPKEIQRIRLLLPLLDIGASIM
jgi:hypothetical protein